MKYLLIALLTTTALATPNPEPSDPMALPSPVAITYTYDKLWLSQLVITGRNPSGEVSVYGVLRPMDSAKKILAGDDRTITVQIPNILARINSGDTDASQTAQKILDYLVKEAKAQGKL